MRIRSLVAVLAAAFIVASCAGGLKPNATTTRNAALEPATPSIDQRPTPAPDNFDPAKVTEEVRSATFVDVRALIESLNQIIRRQDYDAWLSHLTEEYIRYYSDPGV